MREAFRNGILWRTWAEKNPDIFDADDRRLATSQALMPGGGSAHFCEWCAAVKLHQTSGMLSLVTGYVFKAHPMKRQRLPELLSPDQLSALDQLKKKYGTHPPDLLAYRDDFSDWFFAEVKGPGDKMRESQYVLFEELEKVYGRRVGMIDLMEVEEGDPRVQDGLLNYSPPPRCSSSMSAEEG